MKEEQKGAPQGREFEKLFNANLRENNYDSLVEHTHDSEKEAMIDGGLGYDIFSVETVEDDVFWGGEVVESFAYLTDGEVREVYLVDVDEDRGELTYSDREFGHEVSENKSKSVSRLYSSDPEVILSDLHKNHGDGYGMGRELVGSPTAEAFLRGD